MHEGPIPEEMLSPVIAFVSNLDLFKNVNPSALKDLVDLMTFVSLEGGETFIHQGDVEASLYILIQGRLRVFIESDNKEEKPISIGDVSVGHVVGEIAFLTNQPRSSTVKAIRDSQLLKLDEKTFQHFKMQHPQEVIEIARTAINRLLIDVRPLQAGENISTITIAPAGNSDARSFTQLFVEEFKKVKSVLLVNRELCDRHFNKEISQSTHESENHQINRWLNELETQYDYIVLETDREMTPWTMRCIRQSDRLIFVAKDFDSPALNSIEEGVQAKFLDYLPYSEMVFIHPNDMKRITGTEDWLKRRLVTNHYHLRMGNKNDWDRLLRFMMGKAFGVVLNGGGGKGYSHIGVLKALEELKIPIDYVAGSSMGSLIGGTYAYCGVAGAIDFAHYYAKKGYIDYTLPFLSLLSGKVMAEFFHHWLKDTKIEDLWIPFFCVSTNLSKETLHIHDRGLLWLALRTSCSTPAFFPPAYTETGDMLIDGGVMNNMPVDIMRHRICGGKILAVNCNAFMTNKPKTSFAEPWISGWRLAMQKVNPIKKRKKDYSTIFDILYHSMVLGSNDKQRRMENDADYLLECDTSKFSFWDLKEIDGLIETGYRTAMLKLPELLKNLRF